MQDFLPVTREDMKSRGWEAVDFVYVTGDAMWIIRLLDLLLSDAFWKAEATV